MIQYYFTIERLIFGLPDGTFFLCCTELRDISDNKNIEGIKWY